MADERLIKHNSFPVFDRSTLIPNTATFYVNNKVYNGFKNIRLRRSMQSLTGSFDITLTDSWQITGEDFDIKPGDRIHCHLGDEPLFEGYVDDLDLSLSADSRNITIAGRDRTADLVDCSHVGKSEFNDLDLEELAKELVKPFNLKVLKLADVGKKFQKFTIRQGETIFEALDRAAKEREILLLSSTHGNLVLDKKGNTRAFNELREGVNVKVASARFSNSERFSKYIIKAQNSGIVGDATDASSPSAESEDKGITRNRPIIVIAENAMDSDAAQKRANYEASFRAAQAMTVNVTVQGWTQENGKLWQTNQIISINIPSIGIRSDMLISGIKFELSDRGTQTEFELIRPDAFEFKVEVEKKDDPLDNLGWDED